MNTINSDTVPCLSTQQFEILCLSVSEKRNELLIERDSAHHLLGVRAVQHRTLCLADITEVIGGGLANSVDDSSNDVRRQLVMPNGTHNCLDADSGKHHVLTREREVSDTEI